MRKKYQPPTQQFFRLPNNIFDVGLTPIQFMLYSYIVCCSGHKGYCWPSQETISRKTGISKTAVHDHLKILEQRHLIEKGKHRNPGRFKNNTYALLSLDNPEIYRDLNSGGEDSELPFSIDGDFPA